MTVPYLKRTASRNILFLIIFALGLGLFYTPLQGLFRLTSRNELYSHIPLVPFVSLFFLLVQRKTIFSETGYGIKPGIPVAVLGVLAYAYGAGHASGLKEGDYLSLMMSGFFLWVVGLFVLFYGIRTFKSAAFPLLFLVFMVPVPLFILDPFISFLQRGSTEISYGIFKLIGITIYRDGFVFGLPGMTIEVAKQCSGIRSSLALVITAIVAGKVLLETGLRRFLLVLCIFPITMFKNAIRIVTLSLLGAYVDPGFITGSWLHSSGGIVFFILALVLLMPVIWGLRRWERGEGKIERFA